MVKIPKNITKASYAITSAYLITSALLFDVLSAKQKSFCVQVATHVESNGDKRRLELRHYSSAFRAPSITSTT